MDQELTEYVNRRNKIRDALIKNNPKTLSDLGLDRIILTPSIANWLKANSMNLNLAEATQYAECLNDALHWYEEFRRLPAGALTAGLVHQIIDALVERERKTNPNSRRIKCRGGCSTCCYIKVSATEEEGRLLAPYVPDDAREKLERQAKMQTVTDWGRLSDADAACVFLDRPTGMCKVYEKRPAVCRLAYSLTGPSTCGRKPVGKNTAMIWFRAEAVVAAYVSLKSFGSLPEMLLRGLDEGIVQPL